jgi:hypothetical protein
MRQTDTQMLASRIEDKAGRYFESSRGATVTPLRTLKGWNATIRFFEVSLEDGRHPVVAKTFHSRRRNAPGVRPPRLLTPPDWPSPGAREHAALSRIEAGFSGLGDPRFGTVRVLDHLDDIDTLVMETHPGQGMDQMLEHQAWLRATRKAPLASACARAGAWLRAYHELPDLPETPAPLPLRSDLIDAVERIGALLPPDSWTSLREAIRGSIEDHLPERLPAATLHGDFVPRNVLVSDDSVTVFDTRAPSRAPAEFDLARFLLSLKCGTAQALTRGRLHPKALVADLEAALLEGYYESAPARPLVRVHEVIGLLETWALARHRVRIARGIRRHAKRARLRLFESFYAPKLTSLLLEATQ